MKRCGEDWKKAPRWMKELHAWQSGRAKIVITMPERVSPELSLLREPKVLACGFEALRAMGAPRVASES